MTAETPFQPHDSVIDPGIRPVVSALLRDGIRTTESCEGGEGHSFPEPTVRFEGLYSEGFKALGTALYNGLPVVDLRRVWHMQDGELIGPEWEMTFSKRLDG